MFPVAILLLYCLLLQDMKAKGDGSGLSLGALKFGSGGGKKGKKAAAAATPEQVCCVVICCFVSLVDAVVVVVAVALVAVALVAVAVALVDDDGCDKEPIHVFCSLNIFLLFLLIYCIPSLKPCTSYLSLKPESFFFSTNKPKLFFLFPHKPNTMIILCCAIKTIIYFVCHISFPFSSGGRLQKELAHLEERQEGHGLRGQAQEGDRSRFMIFFATSLVCCWCASFIAYARMK